MMIFTQIKGIFTIDHDELESHTPRDPENFSLWIRVLAGPRGTAGEESFDVNVCTPKWLEEQIQKDGFVWGQHRLFVDRYEPARIKHVLVRSIEHYSGDTWKEVAIKISRLGSWEFEDSK